MHKSNKLFCSIILDECRVLRCEPEQAVCQEQLRMRSSYTRVPSCRDVTVGVAFSEGLRKVSAESRIRHHYIITSCG